MRSVRDVRGFRQYLAGEFAACCELESTKLYKRYTLFAVSFRMRVSVRSTQLYGSR